ncbi:Ferroxidase [Arcobacter nitrofigilis DSM 7299]|uniref:Ferritin n=1 Tax=Arcobacter nitrofigilis (strain ATCC 33309 / DSM 7299 / CCUG 15893 / LMG 7604 / NCTC 12251 / CI) TaxID=572480 RepID=D5V4I4_ARCNC|nr:ferritin [Arcobacter nitrofigilis]ADG92889.1 Ferroxidase [Arcobacter nitrofigilis DSM 7299]
MLKKEISDALVMQLNKEFQSSYIYLGMSAYASKIGLNGSSSWFLVQYQEEVAHAMKLFKYLENQEVHVTLPKIEEANVDFKSILDTFKKALAHEIKMSANLNELSDLTMKNKDHATYNMLQWYVTEQVEEEATLNTIIDKIKLVGDDGYGLYAIDQELGSRTFVDPTAKA